MQRTSPTPDAPAVSFEKRWKAINELLIADFGKDRRPFCLLDLGAGTGYFSLQVAKNSPKSQVVAVEGAVGVGNDPADSGGEIIISKSRGVVQTAEQVEQLKLKNCCIAPGKWTSEDIAKKAEGMKADCLLALSVVHDIENISRRSDDGAPDAKLCV